ncbi:MAG: hypothetical protein A2756_02995 [Candidatus Ryanbacteria bacterium RIFCSPHIGHO2_01_FULL_48_27]|uniref:Uncharacterized protein n=1 Tax=Candidatus Ryanbacteria bacterium RIFCSPHIGHO2_01_FULL_48_27 TaxID=1802115 RepID=A0A1G2G6H3_9BACT|nr:MAG: hypothetical protein A2756_02995 [Candidatus Ryanbacteria bacterium RIFCSPHIGHO2_01_FULL_48_27]
MAFSVYTVDHERGRVSFLRNNEVLCFAQHRGHMMLVSRTSDAQVYDAANQPRIPNREYVAMLAQSAAILSSPPQTGSLPNLHTAIQMEFVF